MDYVHRIRVTHDNGKITGDDFPDLVESHKIAASISAAPGIHQVEVFTVYVSGDPVEQDEDHRIEPLDS